MARISQDSFAALQQERIVESRPGGESGFHRQRLNSCAYPVEPCALNKSKTWVPGSQPSEQSNKSRTEKRDAHGGPFRKCPTPKDIAPQKGQDNKVAPNHEFEVVPFPRRGLKEVPKTEDRHRG